MVAASAHGQTFSVLYDFGTKIGDPYQPYVEIVAQGRDGNLYSTASQGGANGVGAAYRITPAGTLTEIYSFSRAGGFLPFGGFTLGKDGNFYGTTYGGSSNGDPNNFYGTIFKLAPNGKLTYLYTFTNGADGAFPYAPPVQGRAEIGMERRHSEDWATEPSTRSLPLENSARSTNLTRRMETLPTRH
jgi:uncharacterized repeat protein (TIGR03803 family)